MVKLICLSLVVSSITKIIQIYFNIDSVAALYCQILDDVKILAHKFYFNMIDDNIIIIKQFSFIYLYV